MLVSALKTRACRLEISTSGPLRSCAWSRPLTPASILSMNFRLMIWRRFARTAEQPFAVKLCVGQLVRRTFRD